ncbi:N-acetylmuramidase family protein [Spirosoma luteolum]
MATTLTSADLIQAASDLGCDVAAIRAVDEVESNGAGFKNGRIVIRFETAVFQKSTGITVNGSDTAAFNRAYKLNPTAAMLATSWGRYQIMGFNYDTCGFSSVGAFVDAMKSGEPRQLQAFVQFVRRRGIADELARHDWAGFARIYNGTGYKAGNYDGKLATAYAKYRSQPLPPDPVKKKSR